MKIIATGLLSGIIALAGAVNASVITKYYDDFSGLQSAALNGTAPDIRPGSETWTARQTVPLNLRDPRADGSMTGGSGGAVSGSLPFSLESGKVYTFTVDATITNPDSEINQWAGIAFRTTSSVDGTQAGSADFASLIMRRDGGAQLTTRNGDAGVNVVKGTYGANAVWQIVLDTTAAQWTADFLINGSSVAVDRNIAASIVPGTAYISIGQQASASVMFNEMTLTVIPEPATLGLFSVAAAAAFLLRRFRM